MSYAIKHYTVIKPVPRTNPHTIKKSLNDLPYLLKTDEFKLKLMRRRTARTTAELLILSASSYQSYAG